MLTQNEFEIEHLGEADDNIQVSYHQIVSNSGGTKTQRRNQENLQTAPELYFAGVKQTGRQEPMTPQKPRISEAKRVGDMAVRTGSMTPKPSYKQAPKQFTPIENPYGSKKAEIKIPKLNLNRISEKKEENKADGLKQSYFENLSNRVVNFFGGSMSGRSNYSQQSSHDQQYSPKFVNSGRSTFDIMETLLMDEYEIIDNNQYEIGVSKPKPQSSALAKAKFTFKDRPPKEGFEDPLEELKHHWTSF